MTEFANNLKLMREKAGLNQNDLADKSDLSQQTISAYESGYRKAKYPTLLVLSKILNCSIDQLDPSYEHEEIHYLDDGELICNKCKKTGCILKDKEDIFKLCIEELANLTPGNQGRVLTFIYELEDKQKELKDAR